MRFVTYEGDSASKKGESIDARAYIRYYDAIGKLRVFYNNYNKSKYYGGCMCSYNQVAEMAIPVTKTDDTPSPIGTVALRKARHRAHTQVRPYTVKAMSST